MIVQIVRMNFETKKYEEFGILSVSENGKVVAHGFAGDKSGFLKEIGRGLKLWPSGRTVKPRDGDDFLKAVLQEYRGTYFLAVEMEKTKYR